ncbi:elongation factor P [Aurantiacibacter sp. MUD11]|uniref:elongation factor P n=1 Tax=Aurantiacibacter sp. MUD11 TaxID=3003265 RepID=UPI0022AA6391|nr:elongation factor P [Aurantiacibacter sp. MUD11]WAT18219.1 elongation factor P [Aurantiacibacter sp. MUD11]
MYKVALTLAAATSLVATNAQAQGQLGTIERGTYVCELPGDAAGAVGIPQPDEGFTIESASRYSSPQGDGTYLRRGDRLIMTSGPRNGDAYEVVGNGFLRKLSNGEPSRLRCIRSGR